ncbi:MAG: cytochrome c [Chloroflexota bacterium]
MSQNAEETQEGAGLFKRLFTELLPVEQRSLLGTLGFMAVLLAVAWVAINEPNRMETTGMEFEGRAIQRGATIFQSNCVPCHGARGEGIPGVAPALNAPDLFDGSRLAERGWTGTLEDYVKLTVAAGRPAKSADWPNPMPTWSQDFGGPLRPDQVSDVTQFVLNWGLAYEAGAEGIPTPIATATPEEPAFVPVGTDMNITLPEGDPARGEALFEGTEPAPDGLPLGCNACHTLDGSALVGPSLQGVASRVPEGYDSALTYFHESIVMPGNYKVPGFEGVSMPDNFGQRLDAQSLADLMAFLDTLK